MYSYSVYYVPVILLNFHEAVARQNFRLKRFYGLDSVDPILAVNLHAMTKTKVSMMTMTNSTVCHDEPKLYVKFYKLV